MSSMLQPVSPTREQFDPETDGSLNPRGGGTQNHLMDLQRSATPEPLVFDGDVMRPNFMESRENEITPSLVEHNPLLDAAREKILAGLSAEERQAYEQEQLAVRWGSRQITPTSQRVEQDAQRLIDKVEGEVFDTLTPAQRERLLFERGRAGASAAEAEFEKKCLERLSRVMVGGHNYDGATPNTHTQSNAPTPERSSALDREAEAILRGYEVGLKPGEEISGEEMRKLIEQATADLDNNAAGGEYQALAQFIGRNVTRMSPEALKVFAAYQQAAKEAQATGSSGISTARMEQVSEEMVAAAGRLDGAGPAGAVALKDAPKGAVEQKPQPAPAVKTPELEHGQYLEEKRVRNAAILGDKAAREGLEKTIAADLEYLKTLMRERPEVREWAGKAHDSLDKMRTIILGAEEIEAHNARELAKIDAEFQDEQTRTLVRQKFEVMIARMKAQIDAEFAKNCAEARRGMTRIEAVLG